ncbi:MAG TPA: phenylalanine--tRNA ligase subunit alpha [Buchnera sp. (in: enterobacteria)]|nr:phenylalanine--tRNA ligase subunit alpha [Buchnera sp. (in: enterobacteria)]
MLNIVNVINLVKSDLDQVKNIKEWKNIKIKYLGKKSNLSMQLTHLRSVSEQDRIKLSDYLNKLKKEIQSLLQLYKEKIESLCFYEKIKNENIDISLSGRRIENGTLHPVTNIINIIEQFFLKLGFKIVTGPEIEDDYHNFSALNIPNNHPARTCQDTFWFDTKRLLRTQTSSVQIRIMEKESPPIRMIVPGKVYRNDYDSTHTPMFHQIEGLIIEKDVSFANLKWIMQNLLYYIFTKDIVMRFRTSYFPFTTPSIEIDILGVTNKWLEVLGCGMVHPNVLNNMGINSKKYVGCAFGLGVERLAMLYYKISDLRYFFENDLRFIKQFK